MKRKIGWMILSGLMVLFLALASCAPAVEEVEEVVAEVEVEEEVVEVEVEEVVVEKEVLYSDDFSDGASGWDTFDDEDGRVSYEGGWLNITNYTSAEFGTYSLAHQYFTDFILEVETKLVAGTDDNFHTVAVRYDEYENYYQFAISADGWYEVDAIVEGETQDVIVGPTRSAHIIQGQDAVNLIRVECVGSTFKLSVNGHLLWEFTDTRFQAGDIALAGASLSGTFTEVAFDNIVVTAP